MLSRFYNIDLLTCMTIPMDQIQIFLSRIEPLRADESLQAIRNNQLGSGFMKENDSKPIIKELQDHQKKLFIGYEAMEQRRAAMIANLMNSGLPLGHASGLPSALM